jgi:thioredoxin 1
MLPYVSDDSFTAEVLESDQPVLVDFTAAWCPPCRAMNPVLDAIAADRDDLRIVKLDVDSDQATAVRYGVLSMPTFMLFRDGAPEQKLIGARPRARLELELEQALEQQPAGG